MSIYQLTPFLQKINVEVLIIAIITSLVTEFIKKLVPLKHKNKVGLIPFILATIFCLAYGFLVTKQTAFSLVLNKGIQAGGLATFLYAFVKQLTKDGTIKKALSEVLKGIINGNSIKETVNNIVKVYSKANNVELNAKMICEIIAKNTSISQAECQAITGIILKALDKI